ncbi:hypothetical protein B0T18DRAFT_374911 [Schizothecium vesticola]|uniref:Cerato-platanin n=1 Tax=Schizothecium vesticola TaxID=314040 RepID=A0AA40K0J0_9PEZI|nr:hypothetical protein B0T18DRAFT_374911 [Schizothecium vesticola]
MISTLLPALALASGAAAKGIWVTPHDSYSSSIGVLGCKINTDRVAYWPSSVDCDNICVKVSHEGRSVHLLKIDQSGGAYDISYDAWNYLQTGKSAATDPIAGGTVPMDYEDVPASECAHLILTDGAKLPLSASNSMNFVTSCLSQPGSFVAKNHVLYNICDSVCSLGHDEQCSLDLAVSNQPACPHTLGLTSPLKSAPVFNIMYQTGKTVNAATGEAASPRARPADPVVPVVEKAAPVVSKPAPVVPVQTPGVFKEVEVAPVAPSSTAAAAVSSAPVPTWAHGRPDGASASWTKEAPTATIAPGAFTTGGPVAPHFNGTHPAGQPVPHSTFLVVASSAPAAQPSAGGAREVVTSAGCRASTSLLLAAVALLGSLLMI